MVTNIVFNVYINPFNIEFCASTLKWVVNSLVFLSLLLFINTVKAICMKLSKVCLAYLISMFNLANIWVSFFLILFGNFPVEGPWQEVFRSLYFLCFRAGSYSSVTKTSGLCYVMLCSRVLHYRVLKSMLSDLPFVAINCFFWREYFITLQHLPVPVFWNTEEILEVSLLKRQRVGAFSLVTIKFRSKTLQKIVSRWPHQIVWAHGIWKLTRQVY